MNDERDIINEEKAINDAFRELLDTYLASQHRKKVELITKAFNFARQAHKGVRRHSGEPYIMHPLEVATIVCKEIGLGSTSICAALLHDVVEDTDYTVEDIRNLFGERIAGIVDGLTKISGGVFGAHASEQAENFKKLLLTMSEDIRVILIKIADRLHNMRTLEFMPVNKQYKIAGETLYIYAPIAYRLGLSKIKTELENLSFRYEHPEEYAKIEKLIENTQRNREILYKEFTSPICNELDAMGLKYRIIGRVKSPYSIWNKMQKKHVTFEEIFDILAVRIIFTPREGKDENNECFNIYIALTKLYNAHPDRLRDWVNKPRTNGYKALHATFMSKRGEWIEVQIRSEKMNEVAEKGIAAHWKYKNAGESSGSDDQLENWLHTIKEILDDPQPNALDFLNTIKLNLYATEIFVFTPKGDIKTMPQNCTALDLAYSIHTFLGNHCIGAKVNHHLVPLNHKLQSGDQVEIITSNAPRVDESWLSFVTTAKARAKILAALRRKQRLLIRDGEELLNKFLEQEGLSNYSNNIEKLWKLHKLKDKDSLLAAIGEGSITLGSDDKDALLGNKKFSFQSLFSFGKDKKKEKPVAETFDAIDHKSTLNLTDENIKSSYIIADCCHPIPGDDVLGYYDDDKHITIHKRNCPVANTLKSSHGDRILAAKWDTHKKLNFIVPIQIKGIDNLGVLNEITAIISQEFNASIQKLHLESSDGIFEGTFWVNVHDVEDVKNLCASLKKVTSIKTIARIG